MAAYIVPCLVFAAMTGASLAMEPDCVAGELRPDCKHDFRVDHWVDPATMTAFDVTICVGTVAANSNEECRKLCYRTPECKFGSYEQASGSCTLAKGPWKKARYLEDKTGWDVVIVTCGDETTTPSPNPSGVMGDPHFLVYVEGSQLPVCFDYFGNDGDMLQLLYNKEQDITVNGMLGKRSQPHTFFVKLFVESNQCDLQIDYEYYWVGGQVHPWSVGARGSCGNLQYLITQDNVMEVKKSNLGMVTIHRKRKQGHLDIFRSHEKLSTVSHGLLGQFLDMEVSVENVDDKHSWISFPSHPERPAVHASQKMRVGGLANGDPVPCWHVGDQGKGLMGRDPDSFLINSPQIEN